MSSARSLSDAKKEYVKVLQNLVQAWKKFIAASATKMSDASSMMRSVPGGGELAKVALLCETLLMVEEGKIKKETLPEYKEETLKSVEDQIKLFSLLAIQIAAMSDYNPVFQFKNGKMSFEDTSGSADKLLEAQMAMLRLAAEQSGQPLPASLLAATSRFGFSSASSSSSSSSNSIKAAAAKLPFKHYVPMPANASQDEIDACAVHMEEKEKRKSPQIQRDLKDLAAQACQHWDDIKCRIVTLAMYKDSPVYLDNLAHKFGKLEEVMKILQDFNDTCYFQLNHGSPFRKADDFTTNGPKIKPLFSMVEKILAEINKIKPITIMEASTENGAKLKFAEYNQAATRAEETLMKEAGVMVEQEEKAGDKKCLIM